jgi:Glycosyl hydrolases family 39
VNPAAKENKIRMRGMRKLGLSAALVVLAGTLLTTGFIAIPSSGQILTAPQSPVPASYFGLNVLFNPRFNVPWPPVPFYGWRLSHVNWPDLEPQKGKWNFDLLDKYVGWSQEHKSEILMTLTYTPRWASSSPDAPSDFPTPGYAGVPRDMNDWRTFVRTVASRYKGRIHVYEIWNEPDRQKDWIGDVDTMIAMVRDASKILKEVDPGITVLSPSPTTTHGLPWMNEFIQKGGLQYVDVVAYHFYVPRGAPEDMVPVIQKVRTQMAQYGAGDKPLWDSEAGWLGPDFFSADQQAAYVARSYILNWATGVQRFYWYAWESHHGSQIELTEEDFSTLTPAARAYTTIQKWMVGASISKCLTSSDKNWVCEMKRGDSKQYIVWNTEGNRNFLISKDWSVAQFTQLDGKVNKIEGPSIHIGIQPILIQ